MKPHAQVEHDYKQIAATDPLFAPHASMAFEVLAELGKGGMGTVFKVRDKRSGRLAALKVLNDPKAGPKSQQRFLREATLTASLDHPCIPPVYEIGRTANGELFLLMRLIEGRTLEQEITKFHQNDHSIPKQRRLLQILIKVAEALAYAHSQEIVHRDLKPANIMVGRFGEVLLMDWGIAKDLDNEAEDILESAVSSKELRSVGLTLHGALVGTPGYMSPEQAEGEDIDGRSDVYALGLLLGEILSGQPLVGGDTTLVRTIANVEGRYTSLMEMGTKAPRPLEWILRKALARKRAQRTAKAEDFVDQLRCYLGDERVPGYNYSITENLTRFLRRRPVVVPATLLCCLLLFLAGSLNRALNKAARKDAQLNLALKDEAIAKENAERARRVLSLFNKAREQSQRGLTEQMETTLVKALGESRHSLEAMSTAAKIAQDSGQQQFAKAILREAAESHPPAYQALFQLHIMEVGSQNLSMTKPLRRLLDRARKRGDENEFTLLAKGHEQFSSRDFKAAIATYSQIEAYSRRFSWMYFNRAYAYAQLKDFQSALADYKRALDIDPLIPLARTNMGLIYIELGDHEKALESLTEAIAKEKSPIQALISRAKYWKELGEYEKALTDFDQAIRFNTRSARLYAERGLIRGRLGHLSSARQDLDRALSIDPNSSDAYLGRAMIRQRAGRQKEALQDFKRAIELAPNTPAPYYNRGSMLAGMRDRAGALRDFNKALEMSPNYFQALINRGLLKTRSKDFKGAERDFNKAIEVRPQSAKAYYNRGCLFERMRRFTRAMQDYSKALELRPRYALVYHDRAMLKYDLKDIMGALEDYSKAIKVHPQYASAYVNRGFVYKQQREYDRAIADFNKALNLEPKLAYALVNRGLIFQIQGKLKSALADFEQFLKLSPKHPGAPDIRKKVILLRSQLLKSD